MNTALNDRWEVHSAYLDNLMFGAMYLSLLYTRQSSKGQSIGIAICKLLGTGIISVAFGFFPPAFAGSPLLWTLFIACLILDVTYLIALSRVRASERADHRFQQRELQANSESGVDLQRNQNVH